MVSQPFEELLVVPSIFDTLHMDVGVGVLLRGLAIPSKFSLTLRKLILAQGGAASYHNP